jgi:hypothetical protein
MLSFFNEYGRGYIGEGLAMDLLGIFMSYMPY